MNERLSWSEAEAIVRRYRAEHGISTDVDVATLAQTLGTDVDEIRRLAAHKPRFTDRSGMVSAGLAFVSVIAVTLAIGPALLKRHPLLASLQRPTPPAERALSRVPRIVIVNGSSAFVDGYEPQADFRLYPNDEPL